MTAAFPQVTCLSVIYINSTDRVQDLEKGLLTTLENIIFADVHLVVIKDCAQYDKICKILDDQKLDFEVGPNYGKWDYWQEEVYSCRTPFLLEVDFDVQAEPRHLRNLLRAMTCLNILTNGKGCMCAYSCSPGRDLELFAGSILFRRSEFVMYDINKAIPGYFRLSCVSVAKQIPRVPLRCGYGTDPIYALALEKTGLSGCWVSDPDPMMNIIQHQARPTQAKSRVGDNIRKFEMLWGNR